jgi:hypothetical protein
MQGTGIDEGAIVDIDIGIEQQICSAWEALECQISQMDICAVRNNELSKVYLLYQDPGRVAVEAKGQHANSVVIADLMSGQVFDFTRVYTDSVFIH